MSDNAKHCADWLVRFYTRSQTSIPLMDMPMKRYVAQRYIGYQVVNGQYIGVQKSQIELQDGTVKDGWELSVPEQMVSPDSKMFYLEEPPMDIRLKGE